MLHCTGKEWDCTALPVGADSSRSSSSSRLDTAGRERGLVLWPSTTRKRGMYVLESVILRCTPISANLCLSHSSSVVDLNL
jgi:hypothetical protein